MDCVLFDIGYKNTKCFIEKIENKTHKDLGINLEELEVLEMFKTYLINGIDTMEKENLNKLKISFPLNDIFKVISVLYTIIIKDKDSKLTPVVEKMMCSISNNELIL